MRDTRHQNENINALLYWHRSLTFPKKVLRADYPKHSHRPRSNPDLFVYY